MNSPLRSRIGWVLIFLLFLAFEIALQWWQGAYRSEFTGWPDETSHYTNGMLIREYILHGLGQHPVRFAENFYLHYPKVAFGMWPPGFHILEGLWALFFGPSRTSMMLLMALITALLSWSLVFLLTPRASLAAGLAAGILLSLLPSVTRFTSIVGPDSLAALLCVWSIALWIRFLEQGKPRDALLFGVVAGSALLTKGNCLALTLAPAVSILLTRRWELLKNRWLYAGALIAGGMGLPWYAATTKVYLSTVEPAAVTKAHMLRMAHDYLLSTSRQLGPVLVLAVLAGMFVHLRRPNAFWASWAGLIAGFYVFHVAAALPGVETRYLMIWISPMLLFACAGIDRLPMAGRYRAAVLAGLVLLFVGTNLRLMQKTPDGTAQAAVFVLARQDTPVRSVLVSSDAGADGTFITEMLMRTKEQGTPDRVVLRAYRWLSLSNWYGSRYKMVVNSPEELEQRLADAHVAYLVLDERPGRTPHHALLWQTVRAHPDRFPLLTRIPFAGGTTAQTIYGYTGPFPEKRKINIPMPFTLKKDLRMENSK